MPPVASNWKPSAHASRSASRPAGTNVVSASVGQRLGIEGRSRMNKRKPQRLVDSKKR